MDAQTSARSAGFEVTGRDDLGELVDHGRVDERRAEDGELGVDGGRHGLPAPCRWSVSPARARSVACLSFGFRMISACSSGSAPAPERQAGTGRRSCTCGARCTRPAVFCRPNHRLAVSITTPGMHSLTEPCTANAHPARTRSTLGLPPSDLGQRVDPDVVAGHLDGDLGERSEAICFRVAPMRASARSRMVVSPGGGNLGALTGMGRWPQVGAVSLVVFFWGFGAGGGASSCVCAGTHAGALAAAASCSGTGLGTGPEFCQAFATVLLGVCLSFARALVAACLASSWLFRQRPRLLSAPR